MYTKLNVFLAIYNIIIFAQFSLEELKHILCDYWFVVLCFFWGIVDVKSETLVIGAMSAMAS